MLLAALASAVIASCYDGDTCTTKTGAKVRLACIDTPELRGKRAEPVPAKAARDHLRGLVVGKKVGIQRITKDSYGRTVAELFVWGDERSAGDGRHWSRRGLLEVCRSMSLDRGSVMGPAS